MYGYGAGVSTQGSGIAMGIALIVVSAVIYFVHWVLAYMVENNIERKGTLLSKLFVVAGLLLGGTVFWFSFVSLVMSLVAFSGGSSVSSALALMLAAIPLWGYFLVKGWLMLRHEPGVGETKHKK
jgi:magnesium-transporting ATPase (P-type)